MVIKFSTVLAVGILTLVQVTNGKDTTQSITLQGTIDVLRHGEEILNIQPTDQVVMFIGNINAGISQAVEVITNSNHRLEENIKTYHDGATYFAMPGINNKHPLDNIAASYLLHQALSTADFVKIILVVNSQVSTDPTQLLRFFLNTHKLLKHADEYKEGLMLLVNQADAEDVQVVLTTLQNIPKTNEFQDLIDEEIQFIQDLIKILTNSRVSILTKTGEISANSRNSIRRLSFVNVRKDIGFPLSEKAYHALSQIREALENNVTIVLSKLTRHVKLYYADKARRTDIIQLIDETKSEVEQIQSIMGEIKHKSTIEYFLQAVGAMLDLYSIGDSFIELQGIDHVVSVVAQMSHNKFDLTLVLWRRIEEILSEAKYVILWYEFVLDLQQQLSTFEIQTQRHLFNVKDIKNWGVLGKEQGLVINTSNFRQFLQTVVRYFHLFKYTGVIDMEVTDIKVNDLNQVLEKTMRGVDGVILGPDYAYVVGNTFTLSEANVLIQHYESTTNISTFSVMANESIIIDSNIVLTRGRHLGIIAPNWKSNGSPYVFILAGKNAPNYENLKGTNGEDGRPGLPGGNGGNFLGLAASSTNVKITVLTNGGRGGDGENGARGLQGMNYVTSPTLESKCRFITYGGDNVGSYNSTLLWDERACGGKGGDGGAGGLGGNPGTTEISIPYQENTEIVIIKSIGLKGQDGLGGEAGLGGENNYFLEYWCHPYCTLADTVLTYYVYPPGERGKNGGNTVGQIKPPEEYFDGFQKTKESYKGLLGKYIQGRFKSGNSVKFHKFCSSF